MDGSMRTTEISVSDLFNAGRWRVEIFTDDNSENIISCWPHVRLDEIAEESSAAIEPQNYEEEKFFYVGLENVEPISGDPVNLSKSAKGEIKSRSKMFSKDNVLYGRLRPYLRKVFLAEREYSYGLCSTEFIVLKPNRGRILPEVLRALLASEAIAKQLSRLQMGAALPRVSPSDFFRASVPLPPLEIQKLLSNKLRKLHNERLEVKAQLRKMPFEFDRLVSECLSI
jgi:type I restriction enzyme S subunit